jgi:hypothetical protein
MQVWLRDKMENPVKATGFTRNILICPEYCKALSLSLSLSLSLVHFPPCAGIGSVTLVSAPTVHEKWPAGTIREIDNECGACFQTIPLNGTLTLFLCRPRKHMGEGKQSSTHW